MAASDWYSLSQLPAKSWTCGHCGRAVGADKGYYYGHPDRGVAIYPCPACEQPTFFKGDAQVPGVAYGRQVDYLPAEIGSLYAEARNCMSVNAFTAAVLASRKLLMHIAVERGAAENLRFIQYVEYLAAQGYVPPNGKGWVDHIRLKGNEATHEILLMTRPDAESLLTFVEMLLTFVFEFPTKVAGK